MTARGLRQMRASVAGAPARVRRANGGWGALRETQALGSGSKTASRSAESGKPTHVGGVSRVSRCLRHTRSMPTHLPEPRPLLYVVAYESDDKPDDGYSPVVLDSQLDARGATLPHLLSSEMKPAINALWYCLHLPRHSDDFLDLPVSQLDAGRRVPAGHNLLLMPIGFVNEAFTGDAALWPRTLLVGPRSELERLIHISDSLHFTLPPLSFDELSNESLHHQWSALKDELGFASVPGPAIDLDLTHLGASSAITLPLMRHGRQLGIDDSPPESGEQIRFALHLYKVQAALAELESKRIPQAELADHMPQAMARVSQRLRLPLVLGLPGQSSRHFKRHGVSATAPKASADLSSELSAIALMVAKDAVARDAWGVVLETCPTGAFSALAELEAHCIGGAKPAGVARIRRRLNEAVAPLWSDDLGAMVTRASAIQLFSDFPLGLATPPNATDPLNMMVPISTRALTPLTRNLPSTLGPAPVVSFSPQFKVLVCECIRPDDRVGQVSRAGWTAIETGQSKTYGEGSFEISETLTHDALRSAVAAHQPDILVISAHGFSDPDRNVAGIVFGDRGSLGIGLGPLPPLVILSACHVDPRGTGAVTIADLLFREGALAVLGTLIPVDVMRNTTLINRFFVYLHETLSGNEPYRNVGEVWHWVQRSNAVHDIASSSIRFESWFMERRDGRPSPQEIFKSSEWSRRLRKGHFYKDSEKLLIEIAEELGDGPLVTSWIRSGYIPETTFYSMLGRPENILLHS